MEGSGGIVGRKEGFALGRGGGGDGPQRSILSVGVFACLPAPVTCATWRAQGTQAVQGYMERVCIT